MTAAPEIWCTAGQWYKRAASGVVLGPYRTYAECKRPPRAPRASPVRTEQAEAIRAWRRRAGLTQVEAAQLLGVPVYRVGNGRGPVARDWQRYESGEKSAPAWLLDAIGYQPPA